MITSHANAKVKQIIQLQGKAKERRKAGVFIVEGFKMLEEAPTDWIQEVYLSCESEAKARENTHIWEKLQKCGYELVTAEVFKRMSDTQTPQGILTVVKQPEYDMSQFLNRPDGLWVVLENLQDPGNLGTILRTGEGAGITGVIMSAGTVDIFNPKTIRSTMGSIYRVPFWYVDKLEEAIARLQKAGIRTYAAHLEGEHYYNSFSLREPSAFLVGNEGNGLTRETAELADAYLKIPMEGQVESLNAAIATALLMYEAHRQRKEWEDKGK